VGFNATVERKNGFAPGEKTMQILDFVGRVLFPQQPRWERVRNVRLLFFTVALVLVTLFLGFVLVRRRMHQSELGPAPHSIFKSPLLSWPAGTS